MDDRRAVQRTRVLRNAKIILDRRTSLIHCTVLDLTGCGACLSLAATYRLPETFELTFDYGRSRRPCQVRWRTDDKIGVSFGKPIH